MAAFAVASFAHAQDGPVYSDGPHVFWHDSTRATVFYLCEGEITKRAFEVSDSLRFAGFCGDSETDYAMAVSPPMVEPGTFESVSRIFAVSDIHGEFEALRTALIRAGVVDSSLRWSWGDGHLVICGDVFDRGDRVTEALWLIHRLEAEAKRAGGRVHYLIGNHEEMVLHGDNRYVNEKYLDGVALKSRLPHQELFGPESELGRWLRTKNAMVRINGILYVHGGISPEFCALGLPVDSLNARMRRYLEYSAVRAKFDSAASFFMGIYGPLWHRGFFEADSRDRYQRMTQAEVESVAACFDARVIVVGHTEQPHVAAHYEGRVYSLDVPIEDLGGTEGLLWQDDGFWRVTVAGDKVPLP
ncbi:MAG: metallophosphoesterase [Candidatus Zixiibacteriota bacterium]